MKRRDPDHDTVCGYRRCPAHQRLGSSCPETGSQELQLEVCRNRRSACAELRRPRGSQSHVSGIFEPRGLLQETTHRAQAINRQARRRHAGNPELEVEQPQINVRELIKTARTLVSDDTRIARDAREQSNLQQTVEAKRTERIPIMKSMAEQTKAPESQPESKHKTPESNPRSKPDAPDQKTI